MLCCLLYLLRCCVAFYDCLLCLLAVERGLVLFIVGYLLFVLNWLLIVLFASIFNFYLLCFV